MWLNSLVSGMQNTASNYGIGNGKNEDPAAALKLNHYIAGMKAGQTIQGEIVSKTGSEVAIKLADDMVLNARLENDMELELGKLLTLEVRSNMGGTLSLSPLFENMGLDANVLKALDMAGLPTNDRTIEMADSMMKNGMSVSRESLQEVFKEVITYKDVPPSDIVSLHKLGVEVTRENLEQFNNYKNLNHQVIRGVTDVVNELPEAFNTLMQSGEPTKAVALFDAVINTVILEQEAEPETVMNQNEPAAITAQENEPVAVMPQVNENPEVPVQVAAQGESEAPAALNETKAETEPQAIPQGKEEAAQTTVTAAPNENQPVNIQNRIIEMYTAARTPEAKAELFADKEFQNLVKEAIVNKWTLTPEAVTDKSNVEALYQRLRTGLSHLELEARETAGTNAPITQAVTNLNNNIDFMNQLNHMYTYIQLPLKMQNGEQHGELFVYTNKHSLASKDGSVSAFLHLDMDNLGPVDCFVAMKDSKVNTNFRLKDDETLKFIEDHMDILNSRLEKRGYSLNAKCNLMDEETSGMEEILKTDNLKVFGGHHSFDVRT